MIFTKEEFEAAWGEDGMKNLIRALSKFATPARRIELMRNPLVNIVYRDYLKVVFKEGDVYLCITAQWWTTGQRIRARITNVQFFDTQAELDKHKQNSSNNSINLNLN